MCVHVSVCASVCVFGWIYPTRIMLLPEDVGYQMKNQVPRMRLSPPSYWSRVFSGAQNNAGHCYCPWFPTRTWWQVPIADDITLHGHRTWIKQVGTDQESSSMLATFNSPGRCFWWEPRVRKPTFWVLHQLCHHTWRCLRMSLWGLLLYVENSGTWLEINFIILHNFGLIFLEEKKVLELTRRTVVYYLVS